MSNSFPQTGARSLGRANVIIVGAGPVGLTTAILLARHGVERIAILERHSGAYSLPRAVHLDAEVFRILQSLGVASEFRGLSRPAAGLRLVDRHLRVLAQFDRDLEDGNGIPQASMFAQPELERILRDRVRAFPTIDLHERMEFVGLEHGRAGVVVRARDHESDTLVELGGDYLVGADGARSNVRECAGIRMRDLRFRQRWLVLDAEIPGRIDGWDGVDQVFDPDRPATHMRVTGHNHRWEFRLAPHESSRDFSAIEQILPLIAPWTSTTPPAGVRLIRSAEYEFCAQVAERWSSGRVFLAGDAAHLTPPFIGQGLGAGLRDAANLAWKLAVALQTDSPRVLRTYERERKPHATEMIRRAVIIGTAMSSSSCTGRMLRAAVLPHLRLIPGIGKFATSTTTPRLRGSRWMRWSLAGRLGGSLAPTTSNGDTSCVGYSIICAGSDVSGYPFVLVRPDGTVAVAARTHAGFHSRVRRYASSIRGASASARIRDRREGTARHDCAEDAAALLGMPVVYTPRRTKIRPLTPHAPTRKDLSDVNHGRPRREPQRSA